MTVSAVLGDSNGERADVESSSDSKSSTGVDWGPRSSRRCGTLALATPTPSRTPAPRPAPVPIGVFVPESLDSRVLLEAELEFNGVVEDEMRPGRCAAPAIPLPPTAPTPPCSRSKEASRRTVPASGSPSEEDDTAPGRPADGICELSPVNGADEAASVAGPAEDDEDEDEDEDDEEDAATASSALPAEADTVLAECTGSGPTPPPPPPPMPRPPAPAPVGLPLPPAPIPDPIGPVDPVVTEWCRSLCQEEVRVILDSAVSPAVRSWTRGFMRRASAGERPSTSLRSSSASAAPVGPYAAPLPPRLKPRPSTPIS